MLKIINHQKSIRTTPGSWLVVDTLIGCPESEIEYSAQVIPNLGYQGFLSIPFATIQNATYPNGAVEQSSSFNTQYRMNMYRVDFPTTTSPTEY
ncbi:hypothetical protein PPL_07948 [Heterostelium album PN500]|uniref:Uncharacterized protein n=1 Tax=Heterostelium pallidum (strain ATCC 26659 / Pp 5 / PN500) TaxID=670386 RepID=D3BHE6_HETP5|nr:hypothetical protein PPL_07948 [Heterostelium album PN500]EFA79123.1 hypothetical protein PPL_07948 [Heterostelium album PN500]|eukprot:XP_020431245.1 hypothetical protein PPL_07948 [Heterostelium album PN500]